MMIPITYQEDYSEVITDRLDNGGSVSSWESFVMAYDTAQHLLVPEFKGLQCPSHLPQVDFLPHQVECAQKVIEDMNGRAILADEVGLGKTIEAGLILKEYMIRGLVKKILILAPASLVNQWVNELQQKFYIPAAAYRKGYNWDQHDIFVTSIDTAKRDGHRQQILEQHYDMVIIDEAHKLKNHKTKNYEFCQQLNKTYCLLLTATPVQNKLSELFNLVTILKPGHLGTYEQFTDHFGNHRSKLKEDAYLKQLIQHVMVRNSRQQTGLDWTKRKVQNITIDFSEEEKQVYDFLSTNKQERTSFLNLTLLRELCSSREACYMTLREQFKKEDLSENRRKFFEELASKIEQMPHHSKAKRVIELIQQEPENEKFIIFTEYRATQLYLQWFLQQHGISSVPFRGGFKRSKKDWMKQLFKQHAQVLIATEAGGEGINLQFCHNMINYDLPWNPMRLEQRIGRIHRFGQEEDVHIYNFAIKDTVEDQVLTLLYEKIQLFERVIGDLDDVLQELNISNIEEEVSSIFASSESVGEAKIKMENLSSVIAYTQQKKEQEYEARNYS
ncbi:SNF2-related protein [Bacillaceae bacterium S4-13-58]